MKRVVIPESLKDGIGGWKIACPTCPLMPHLKALNLPARACFSGISTNMQGAITLHKCEHTKEDSVTSEGKTVTLECSKEDA